MTHPTNGTPDEERRDELYQRALERTVPLAEFSPAALKPQLEQTLVDPEQAVGPERYLERTHRETSTNDPTLTGTDITDFVHDTQFPADLLIDPVRSGKRYGVVGVIGKGATGRIFEMRDNGLNRTVAVKLLDKKRERKKGRKGQFVHEARVTATLEHPNIMPVHDIGITARGELYFTMKKVTGCSVGDAIRTAKQDGEVHPEFATIDGRIRIFLKVCDALTYAHSRGYIHQDAKPDNIMLGEHGEVLLLDWGSALSKGRIAQQDEPGLVGTPAYMSPEQARREKSDERSDVYCLGATLFHALLLRHPTWAADPETFWEKKRAGIIDPLSPEERRAVPAALLDIALKATRPDPDKRYQSVAEMAEDLKRYQAGRAVSAHRDSPLELFLRWYRPNARLFWISIAALATVGVVGGLLFHERIQELMTWDRLSTEEFAYEHTAELAEVWEYYRSTDWVNVEEAAFSDTGGWRVEDGALIGENATGFDNLAFKRRLPGDIRVEWEATALRNNQNLNCFIAGKTRFDGYTFHIGGWNSPKNFVLTKGAGMQILDHFMHPEGLQLGKTHRFRMEKVGPNIRLFLDGTTLFDYRDLVHLSGIGHQTFGFENSAGNRIRIDNVKVYYRPLPLKVSPLVAADRYYQKGHFVEAREQYREIFRAYPDNEIAPLALFKGAKCLIGMDSLNSALQELWLFRERYPDHELVALSLYERARLYERRGSRDIAWSFYRSIAERHPEHPVLRTILFNLTTDRIAYLDSLVEAVPLSARDSAFYFRLNRERHQFQARAGELEVSVERNSFLERLPEVLHEHYPLDSIESWFPGQRHAVSRLLHHLGRYERVVDDFADQDETVANALMSMGQYERVIEQYRHAREVAVRALMALERYDEVITHYRDQRYEYGQTLMALGRHGEVMNAFHDYPSLRFKAAHRLGELAALANERAMSFDRRVQIMHRFAHNYDSALALIEHSGLHNRREKWNGTYGELLVLAGRESEVLKRYSDSSAFVRHKADALISLGKASEVLRRYPRIPALCIAAHAARGEHDSIVQKYPDYQTECIAAERARGRSRQLYERYPRRPKLRAELLLELGELEQLVREFPEQSTEAGKGLLVLGRYDELLERYPNEGSRCREALQAKGVSPDSIMRVYPDRAWAAKELYTQQRYDSVVAEYADIPFWYSLALVRLGRWDEIPRRQGFYRVSPEEYYSTLCYRALLKEMERDHGAADSLLALPNYFSYVWESRRFLRFLLKPVLEELRGEKGAVERACDRILRDHRYQFGQMLWHEAAFLSGRMSEEQFRNQPTRSWMEPRLQFYRALRDELAGETASAIEGYRAVLGLHPFERDNMLNLETVRELMRWRLGVLSGES